MPVRTMHPVLPPLRTNDHHWLTSFRRFRLWMSAAAVVFVVMRLIVGCPAFSAEPSVYSAGKCNSGELKFIDGLPVVTAAGTPDEIGQQLGTLLKAPLSKLLGKKEEIAHGFGLRAAPDLLVKTSRLVVPAFPESQRREMQSLMQAAGVDWDTLAFANIVYEISHFPACSSLAVEPQRSATGQTIFGRNLDFPTFGFLDRYSLIEVIRPQGKHAFVSVTFPGVVGVFSGMNDAGLCVAQLEVNYSADHAPRVNFSGTPVAMCFRRLLEECSTIDEAEKLLREQNRMMMCNLAVCDRTQSAVFEITPKTVARRDDERGLCLCTNHFRTPELAVDTQCRRYEQLSHGQELDKLTVSDVSRLLNSANQNQFTIQTMIFEPTSLLGHISLGPAPSSAQPLKAIDFAALLRPENGISPAGISAATP
jgi:isopenicillin-N N-acyltransferase like protein